MALPTEAKDRKEYPIARGVFDYFPDAIAAVAHVSFVGNKQHNPGEELHWAREKSNDHADCIARHLIERNTIDTDGLRHAAKLAWRALALLQLEIEAAAEPVDVPWVTVEADLSFADIEEQRRIDAAKPGEAVRVRNPATVRVSDPLDQRVSNDPAMSALARLHTQGSTAYISGPMRGIDFCNFPAFDEARNRALRQGWNVISPADIDRAHGLDAIEDPEGVNRFVDAWTDDDLRAVVQRDMNALMSLRKERGDAIIMLKGWEKSTGALAEFMIARWLGLKVLHASTIRPMWGIHVRRVAMNNAVRKYLNETADDMVPSSCE